MWNQTVSDIMNAVLSYKCRSKTLSDGIISRKNDENLIGQIVENDTRNLKFILFHADYIHSNI